MKEKEPVVINLTPHSVTVLGEDGQVVATVRPSGEVLRLPEVVQDTSLRLAGVPVVEKSLDPDAKLPPVRDGVYYIVSLPVAQAARRPDFIVPDDLYRDPEGRVIGCRRFAVIA